MLRTRSDDVVQRWSPTIARAMVTRRRTRLGKLGVVRRQLLSFDAALASANSHDCSNSIRAASVWDSAVLEGAVWRPAPGVLHPPRVARVGHKGARWVQSGPSGGTRCPLSPKPGEVGRRPTTSSDKCAPARTIAATKAGQAVFSFVGARREGFKRVRLGGRVLEFPVLLATLQCRNSVQRSASRTPAMPFRTGSIGPRSIEAQAPWRTHEDLLEIAGLVGVLFGSGGAWVLARLAGHFFLLFSSEVVL